MKTQVKKIKKNKVELKVEVPSAEVERALNKAALSLAHKVNIPGFRKGKIPRSILENRLGKEALVEEALREELPLYYYQAIVDSGIEPIGTPKIDIVKPLEQGKSFIFKATVEVKPEVELKDYKGIKLEKPSTSVRKAEVEQELELLRDRFAELKEVEKNRRSHKGDFVLIDFEGYLEGKPLEGGKGTDYLLEIGSKSFWEEFENQLIGVRKGEEREVKITFPQNYYRKELAGKEVTFKVKIKEVKEKVLPPLDEKFAQRTGFKNLDDLKKNIKERLKAIKTVQAENFLRREVVKKATERAKVDIPEAMVQRYTDRMLENFVRNLHQRGTTLDDYLKLAKITEEDLRKNLAEDARQLVKTDLVLEAIGKKENIGVTEEELNKEFTVLYNRVKASEKVGDSPKKREEEERRKELLREAVREEIQRRKIVDFLVESAEVKK